MLKRWAGIVAVTAMLGVATPAAAIDVMPGDYTILPSGTNLFLLYGQYATRNKLKVDGIGNIPSSQADTALGIVRYLHYSDINGIPIAVQAFLPFGGFTEAKIGGVGQSKKNGIGDLTAGFTFWPVHTTGPYSTTIGITLYGTAPTGAYSGNPNTVNLGSGTWTFTPQIGLIQGLVGSFFIDAAFDVAMAADHTEQGLKRSQTASEQFQAYLRYQLSPTTALSFGYSGTFGGRNSVGGAYIGTKTREDQLRIVASTFLTPTVQLQGMVGTDVHASAGFKEAFVGQLRLLKLF